MTTTRGRYAGGINLNPREIPMGGSEMGVAAQAEGEKEGIGKLNKRSGVQGIEKRIATPCGR